MRNCSHHWGTNTSGVIADLTVRIKQVPPGQPASAQAEEEVHLSVAGSASLLILCTLVVAGECFFL